MGLGPGARNKRQTAWERMNNDAHLKKNIRTMKPTISTQPKKTWKSKLKKRQRIIDRVKAIPDPVSRTMTAARELQLRIQELTAAHIRSGVDDGGDRFGIPSKNKKDNSGADSVVTTIIANTKSSVAASTAKRIRHAVRIVSERWSVPRSNVSRLWLEVVLPESNVVLELGKEKQDGYGDEENTPAPSSITPPTRFHQFGTELRKCCRDVSSSSNTQELFAAYVERRCVSDDALSVDHLSELWKNALKYGLEEDTIFGWHAGILGAVRILASVEMTEEKRTSLRERLSSFIKWMNKEYEPSSVTGQANKGGVSHMNESVNGFKSLAAKRSMKSLAIAPISTAFVDDTAPEKLPTDCNASVAIVATESIERASEPSRKPNPVPPTGKPRMIDGPRDRSIKAKSEAKKKQKGDTVGQGEDEQNDRDNQQQSDGVVAAVRVNENEEATTSKAKESEARGATASVSEITL